MQRTRGIFEFSAILLVGAVLMITITINADRQYGAARDRYIASSRAQSQSAAHRVEDALRSLHRDLRRLTLLPGIKAMDRADSSLGTETRALIEQITLDLASTASVSKIYIVPANIDPDRSDGLARPILAFGSGGSGAVAEACASNDDRRLRTAFDWMRRHIPNRAAAGDTNAPLVGGPAGPACDALSGAPGGRAAEPSTLLFTVPVFSADATLTGGVTAVLPEAALHHLLPPEDVVLINQGYGYRSAEPAALREPASARWIAAGAPDPTLIYSEVIGLDVNDARSPWSLWIGKPLSDFRDGAEPKFIRLVERAEYGFVAALMLSCLICVALLRRNSAMAVMAVLAEEKLEQRVTERTAAMHHLATHDALTGLPNRIVLREKLDEAMARVRRGDKVALHCLDLDRFKAVNDTFGHPVGDALLKAVAERLKRCVREADLVARLGGDEFVIVQLVIERPDQAAALAERIVEVISAVYGLDGHAVTVGTSIGIAFAPSDGDTSESLLRNADLALYRAKHDGRGTYRFFETVMDARVQERREFETELRRALQEQTFVLHYQPVVDVRTGAIKSFEALLRWRNPDGRLMSPGEFIPAAEEIGLIAPLGEWVIGQACRDAACWPEHLDVSINLSAQQFKSHGLPHAVATALARSGLAPSRLELDIRETVLLSGDRSALAILHELRGLGVRIALDDFGTGSASLGLLRTFPFDKIKIDRIFVQESAERPDCVAIMKTVASLGASLGLITTAKGIETEAQLELVREHGFAEVQGYLLGMPLPAAELDTGAVSQDVLAA